MCGSAVVIGFENMKQSVLNGIRYIGIAIQFFALGIIAGLSFADVQFRYPYLLVALLIALGTCARIFAKRQMIRENRQ